MKLHETLCAMLLDRMALAADGQAAISGGDEQLAWKQAAAAMRACAQAMTYRNKSIDQLVNDIRRPRQPVEDLPTQPDRPTALRRERGEE